MKTSWKFCVLLPMLLTLQSPASALAFTSSATPAGLLVTIGSSAPTLDERTLLRLLALFLLALTGGITFFALRAGHRQSLAFHSSCERIRELESQLETFRADLCVAEAHVAHNASKLEDFVSFVRNLCLELRRSVNASRKFETLTDQHYEAIRDVRKIANDDLHMRLNHMVLIVDNALLEISARKINLAHIVKGFPDFLKGTYLVSPTARYEIFLAEGSSHHFVTDPALVHQVLAMCLSSAWDRSRDRVDIHLALRGQTLVINIDDYGVMVGANEIETMLNAVGRKASLDDQFKMRLNYHASKAVVEALRGELRMELRHTDHDRGPGVRVSVHIPVDDLGVHRPRLEVVEAIPLHDTSKPAL